MISEHDGATVDDALDFYGDLIDAVRERLRDANDEQALNAALAFVIAGG